MAEGTEEVIMDPEGLVGFEPTPSPEESARRMLVSAVWDNVPMRVLTEHGMEATWVGGDYPEPCRLYAYSRGYCMTGCKHPGMDISMPKGTPLRAIEGGNIFAIRNPGVSGSIEVRVRVANGDQHLYNHMSRAAVAEGQNVATGDLLGFSGVSNSPHLHFELRRPNASCTNGVAIIDPEELLTIGGVVREPFAAGARIKVIDPPLNFRTGPGLDAEIVGELDEGTGLVVVSGPVDADGFEWYQVTRDDNTMGWVAGSFCDLA
jgi:hypothetical protein